MSAIPRPVTFAVPGDIATRTGGYLYDAEVMRQFSEAGRDMAHLALPGGFPDPSAAEMAEARAALTAVPSKRALIVDGLAFGALDTPAVDAIRAPIVALVHHPLSLETGLAPDRAAALKATEAANLARAAAVVVPSPHTARTLAAEFGVPEGKITVALPGTARAAALSVPETPPLILSVGSLVPRKGHDVLIDALTRLTDLPWRAAIVGGVADAACADRLAGQRDAAGLGNRVTFAGSLEAGALHDLFARASIFALATRYEGYGMVFAEALAHGLPIVSCLAGAVPDTVPAEAGTLVAPDDAGAFAAALRPLLADGARRDAMAAAARAAGARLPSWEETAGRFFEVVDGL